MAAFADHPKRATLVATVRAERTAGLSQAEVHSALDALLGDPDFRASPRNKDFLRFIVCEQLEGRGERIKAYTIATQIFGRSAAFDPIVDPIVRIEARRLRAALAQYYTDNPRRSPVRVSIPKGGYAPAFEWHAAGTATDHPAQEVEDVGSAEPEIHKQIGPQPRRWLRGWMLMPLGLALGAAASLAAWLPERSTGPKTTDSPILLVDYSASDDPVLSPSLRNALITTLSRFERWQVRETDTDGALKTASSAISSGYVLSLRQDESGLWWRLTDQRNRDIIGSDVSPVSPDDLPASSERIFADIADRIGGSRGLVVAAEVRRQATETTLGYGCLARMEAEIWIWDRRDRLPAIRTCLEETLRIHPDAPEYLTALARVMMRMEPFAKPRKEVFVEADRLISRARALMPSSSQAEAALMILKIRQLDFQGAADAGLRAIELNPADRSIRSYAGAALFASGRFDEGSEIMRAAESPQFPLPPEITMYLAMDAYRRSDYREAIRRANMVTSIPCFCNFAVRAASYAALGQDEDARREVEALVEKFPEIPSTFTSRMAVLGFNEQISDAVRSGLAEAGLSVR